MFFDAAKLFAIQQHLDGFACRDQPERCRHGHRGTVAMAVEAAVDITSACGRTHRLSREHAAHMHGALPRQSRLPQALPQRCKQRVMRDLGQILYLHMLPKLLSARSAHRDQRNMLRMRPRSKHLLGPHLVTGVDHHIHRDGQERRPVVRLHELLDADHLALGVDVGEALLQSVDLGLAQGGADRLDLPIHVGLADVVQIDQHQGRHAAACKRFRGP
ncbi:hypothetical protein V4F39_26385 [Aquincola sp. MAHUQ-54]|uniref:Uncharacterized protein n=1 Tax=Aquincola agrisoli TaxID=3119538 RepID=A0AAW9QRA6_9BURK